MNNNSPHIEPELLSAYLDNEITVAERAVIEAHLPGCVACQTELASLRWTVSLVQALPQPSLPRTFYITEAMLSPDPTPHKEGRSWWRIFAPWGAVVAALLVVAVFASPFLQRDRQSSDTAAFESAPVIAIAPTGEAAGGAAPGNRTDGEALTTTAEASVPESGMTAQDVMTDDAIALESPDAADTSTADSATVTYSITAPLVTGSKGGEVTAEAVPAPTPRSVVEEVPAPNSILIIAIIVLLLGIIAVVVVRGVST